MVGWMSKFSASGGPSRKNPDKMAWDYATT